MSKVTASFSMMPRIIPLILYSLLIKSKALTIDPTTNDEYATVELVDDPRNINKVNNNNRWKLSQDWDNPLHDWYDFAIFTFCQSVYSF